MKNKWTKTWPKQKGYYWFYSLSKHLAQYPEYKPELTLMEVNRISNGYAYVSQGQFIFESEMKHAWFLKAILPNTDGLINEE